MIFLQPFVLWALPLILLPVVIHLINRMRHRSQPWAAMQFLVAATRNSVSHAKLRQFLILFFRVLAVLLLILFLSRPLSGGWLGWALSPAPDAVLILFDRSASMETGVPGTTVSRREQALKLLVEAVKPFERSSHLVLIESVGHKPQELAGTASLLLPSLTGPTDTAADIPAMLQSALTWLLENRAGTAEIWITSDLQRSNWHPEDARLKTLVTQLSALPQKVRIRLLDTGGDPGPDLSVQLSQQLRRQRREAGELQFTLDLQRNQPKGEPVPLEITLDGVKSQVELAMDGQGLRWQHKLPLRTESGWGAFTLPADANPRNNQAYFVYGPEVPARGAVFSEEKESARFLQLAASTQVQEKRLGAASLKPGPVAPNFWSDKSLLLWQGALPAGAMAEQVRTFVEEGGAVLFLPPGRPEGQPFAGIGWGEVQSVTQPFPIKKWEEDQGPLAKTEEGLSLPLGQLTVKRRQVLTGNPVVLASYVDGTPFLARKSLGRGEVYFCSTLPQADWSSLEEGPVLVPMVQRLLLAGTRRLQGGSSLICGEVSSTDLARPWTALAGERDIRSQAGIYRSGERWVAVNRPASEDEPEVLDPQEARRVFGNLSFAMLQEKGQDPLQGEVWRLFLFGMLGVLIVEGMLILPQGPTSPKTSAPKQAPRAARNEVRP